MRTRLNCSRATLTGDIDRRHNLITGSVVRFNHGCLLNVQAFAQGLCVSSCGDPDPAAVCARFLDIDGFQDCLRDGGAYAACNEAHYYPMSLRACDASKPCRPDHVCAKTDSGVGGCVPTYFMFQLRADGYPLRR